MSRHIAPHRWADALAGRLEPERVRKMDDHAAACTRCTGTRRQVERAVESFAAIASQPAPQVGWDSVRARVHWSVSTAKHRRVEVSAPRSRHWARWFAVGIGAAGLAAVAYLGIFARDVPAPPLVHRAGPPPEPMVALVSRLAGDVWIDGSQEGSTEAFAKQLGAGTVLATGAGRIDLQFGQASGLALGPRSSLKVVRLDAQVIELAVDGVVDIDVGPRGPGERFVVTAGDYAIEVRGTRFTVTHDGRGTRVACRHGLVAVRDRRRAGALEVGAARSAFVAADAVPGDWLSVKAVPLTAEEAAQFATSAPFIAPIWSRDLLAHSAPLTIASTQKRSVRIDGIEVGEAPLRMRVMPGRHTIETADPGGRFRRAGWVDVSAAEGAVFEVADAAARPTSSSTAQRKKQFAAGIDWARLGACTRRLTKSGLTDTVHIEISVDTHGEVNVLNIIDTDLPAGTATCVHDVLSGVRFDAGPAATWRDRIDL